MKEVEWAEILNITCTAYNFFPDGQSKESATPHLDKTRMISTCPTLMLVSSSVTEHMVYKAPLVMLDAPQ